jgi:hypothetical protein
VRAEVNDPPGEVWSSRLRGGGAVGGSLEDGEGGALWIGHDGNAPDVLEIGRRHVEGCAEIFRFGGSGVAIGNGEIRQPVGGSPGPVVRRRRNAADELLAVLDVPVIVSGVFGFLHDLPAKEVRIELSGARLVWRTQVRPAERAMRRGDAYARVFLGLPEAESGTGGILHDGHAAGIENVEGRSKYSAAKLPGAGSGEVRAFDRDVELPMGRNTVGELFGTKRAACGRVPSCELENGIEVAGAHGHVVGGPAKNFGVEADGGVLVGGGELGPAECAGGVFFDVGHSGERALPEKENRQGAKWREERS